MMYLNLENWKEGQLKSLQEKIKKELKKRDKKDCLYLEVDRLKELSVMYNKETVFILSDDKELLTCPDYDEFLRDWEQKGMKIDDEIINWKGGKYQINEYRILERIDIYLSNIYDFVKKKTCRDCNDENLKRWSNGRPIIK